MRLGADVTFHFDSSTRDEFTPSSDQAGSELCPTNVDTEHDIGWGH